MGEYSYILEQQGKTTAEKLAAFTADIGWRDELATYRIAQDEYDMRAAAAADQGISLLDEPPYTAEELAKLDAESAAYYEAFAANYVATAAFSGSGSGTQSDPYIITNRAELESIADDLTAYYQLANHIDLGGSSSPWTSIGTSNAPFTGTLDGTGSTIANAYMTGQRYGIIGIATSDAVITKVAFQNVDISYTGLDLYAVAHGPSPNSLPTISYCTISGSLQNTQDGVYSIGRYTNIHDCWVDVDIQCGLDCGVGGVNCINVCALGSIHVSPKYRNVGGIVGRPTAVGIQLSNCVALYDSITYSGTDSSTVFDRDAQGRILGSVRLLGSNNYASTSMQTSWSPTPSATGKDGLNVDPSTYHTQAFWQNALGWDFDTVWYWDSTANLPKLRAFLHGPTISSVSATPTTGGVDTEITLSATVQDATSYQWQYSTNSGGTWQDITGATAATSTWTPGAVGTYQVQLLATNSDGTTTSDPVTVIIYPSPTISDVTIYPNPSDESATFLMSVTVNES